MTPKNVERVAMAICASGHKYFQNCDPLYHFLSWEECGTRARGAYIAAAHAAIKEVAEIAAVKPKKKGAKKK